MIEVFSQLASAYPVVIAFGILFVLLLCGFGLPLPEDIVLAFTGYVVYRGVLPLWLAIFIGLIGVLAGDSSLFWIGHHFGERVMNLKLIGKMLPPQRLKKIRRMFDKYGSRVLFAARFMPVMRSGIFLFAGWARVRYFKFLATDGTAALISVPAIITSTWYFGEQIEHALLAIKHVERWIVIGIVVVVLIHFIHNWRVKRKEKKQNGLDHRSV